MLKLNHLTGFGSGVAGAAAGGDVTSYVFDGIGDRLTVPNHADWFISTSDYTIECFVRHTDHVGTEAYFGHKTNGDNKWQFGHIHGTGLQFQIRVEASDVILLTGTEITDSIWHHVALTRTNSSNLWELYLDGTRVDTITDSDTDATFTDVLEIAARGGGDAFAGSIDEIRISNTNRYTGATLTVPTSQFESDVNSLLLIHSGEAIVSGTTGSGATFTDSGNTGHTVSENGDAIRDTSIYKF